jgi:hypothetical protein
VECKHCGARYETEPTVAAVKEVAHCQGAARRRSWSSRRRRLPRRQGSRDRAMKIAERLGTKRREAQAVEAVEPGDYFCAKRISTASSTWWASGC